MKNWLTKNLKNIIVTAFVIPILLVAFVSISHVTSFYGLSNPFTWAIYLSVGIEIAALSALAAVSVNMGRFVYLPFFIVTLIQMLGNIFFSFTYIDETGQSFKDWIDMTGGLFEIMGVERTDLNSHKTILSFLTGGLLPIISLTFAHMLVKFSEQNQSVSEEKTDSVEITTEEARRLMEEKIKQEEEIRYKPTQEDLQKLEEVINVINHEPIQQSSEPITPTQEDLDKLQDFLNKQYVDQVENSVNSEDTKTIQNDEVNQNITLEEETINNLPNRPRSLRYVNHRIYGR
jgi:polyhydroxyalkanoate synthesis regulator phasin